MNYTHMNHVEPDHIMTFHNPNDPLGLPHFLMSEDYKLHGWAASMDDDKQLKEQQEEERNR